MPFPGTSLIPIQFSGGLNSKVDEFSVKSPYLLEAKNVVYNKLGRIDKRAGFTCLSNNIMGGGQIDKGFAITTFNKELLLLDGTSIYSYQPEADVWIDRGFCFSTTNSQVRVLNLKVATQSNPDAASFNGISVYAWEDNRTFPSGNNGVRYSVVNNDTGTFIVSDQLIYAAGTRPIIVHNSQFFYIYYQISANTIASAEIPIANPNMLQNNLNIIMQDGDSTNTNLPSIPYDVCMFDNAPLVCYLSIRGLQFIYNQIIEGINNDLNVSTVSLCVDSDNFVWLAYSDNTNTYISRWIYNGTDFNAVLNPTIVSSFSSEVGVNLSLIEGLQAGTVNLTIEVAAPIIENFNINNNYCDNFTITSTGQSTYIGQIRGVGLASRPFRYGSNIFLNTVAQSNLQATYFTHCLTQGSLSANSSLINFPIVAKHSPENGGTYRTNHTVSHADPYNEAGAFLFAGQRKGAFTSFQDAQTVNLGCAGYTIDFESLNTFNNVAANNNLHIVGGIKKIYDGVSTVEDNFNLFPETFDGYGADLINIDTAAGFTDGYFQLNSTIAGNLTYNPLFGPAGNRYQWCVVYEWSDNYGQIQRSQPSIPITAITTAANQGAELIGPMLRLTDKVNPRGSVSISIYRTQVNGTVFYKITNDSDPLVNNPTTDFFGFIDTLSDLDIAANENLYTGSQLANTAPPPCSLISLMQNRLMINSTEDTGVVWYSQNVFEQDQYSTLPLDWNSSFIEGVSSRLGNDITALGLLDAQLVIFKETSIWLLSGDGPNALFTSGQFNDAQLLVSDTGCSNQNSLCFITQTPNLPGGLLFKSPKGIYLLGRDESLTYIGAPVEKYNDLTITSANLLSNSNQVVFTTLEGTALVYNYYFNAWSTWSDLPAIDAVIWNDQLCILTPNGSVMMQGLNGFSDTHPNNVVYPVQLSITTPWIDLSGGLQGYQNIYGCYILGTLQGEHSLQVSVAYNYNPSITGNVIINSNIAAAGRWGGLPAWGSAGSWGNAENGGTPFSNYQFEVPVKDNRCESFQLTIQDVNNPAFTQGFSLNGLALEVQSLPGPVRLPQANKIGIR